MYDEIYIVQEGQKQQWNIKIVYIHHLNDVAFPASIKKVGRIVF